MKRRLFRFDTNLKSSQSHTNTVGGMKSLTLNLLYTVTNENINEIEIAAEWFKVYFD